WSAPRSASDQTATGTMPSSRSVTAMRQSISPRLAIRTFLNMDPPRARRSGSLHPAGLALGEERREALARLVARAHLGQPAGERGAVPLPADLAPQLEQHLDAGRRVGRAGQERLHALLDLRVQLGRGDRVVHELDAQRRRRVEALAGE